MTGGRVAKSRKKARHGAASGAGGAAATAGAAGGGMRRGGAARPRDVREAVSALFDQYKDADADKIGPESLEVFFDAIAVDPLDVSALIFAWKLDAKVPCEFSRAEFVDGLTKLGVDSLPKLRKKVHTLKAMISDPGEFRSFYMFAFDYNKPQGQRSMPIETAKQLFPLLLANRFVHLELWLEFLEGRKHAITRDSFLLLLEFATTVHPDFSNFDEEGGAWPVLIDEFVEYAKKTLPVSDLDGARNSMENSMEEDDED